MRTILMAAMLLMSSTALAVVGQYTQKAKMRMGGYDQETCVADGGTWVDETCEFEISNLIEIAETEHLGLFDMSISTMGSTGNMCDLEIRVRRKGLYMVPVTRLSGASDGYSVGFLTTQNGIRVVEVLGEGDISSPGCGYNAFISGNGEEFIKE